jgi:FlaA1/EpsC-like NDP-sugar epimerase
MPENNAKTHTGHGNKSTPGRMVAPATLLLRFRRPLILFTHITIFAASLLLSFLIVHNMRIQQEWFVGMYPALLLLILIVKLPVFGLFKQYRGWWHYVGITDLMGIIRASMVSTTVIVLIWLAAGYIDFISKYIPAGLKTPAEGICVADMCATVLMLASLRMIIRLYHESIRPIETGGRTRLLIVGAGNAGEALLRELQRMPAAQYEVVGFIDEDPAKQGTQIHSTSVLGTVEQLPEICRRDHIGEIAIAMPSANARQLRRVIQVCEGTKTRFRTVPSITDIASGKLRVSQIRDVDINDLLGREAVRLEQKSVEAFVKNKTILITGAGGSIGSEMCRQLCGLKPGLLLLVEQAENPLFHTERQLRWQYPSVPVAALICNITDKISLENIFEHYRPDVVIHAAAHKHVPLMELNPSAAVKNNILGTKIVADAAEQFGATHFVLISTDKAVRPVSIMGASKRIAEMYVQDLGRTSKTNFITVRFGNVLDSEGSVVQIFRQQIACGGPVTITDARMKRFFMTIPEASQLVLQASAMGKGGEIFVLDMGEPVKIVDLARELITLSGLRPGEDIDIVFTGIRPGEKLYEELSIEGEDMQLTKHPKIRILKNIPMDRDALRDGIEQLIEISQTRGRDEIISKIRELVPEYKNHNTEFVIQQTAYSTLISP